MQYNYHEFTSETNDYVITSQPLTQDEICQFIKNNSNILSLYFIQGKTKYIQNCARSPTYKNLQW